MYVPHKGAFDPSSVSEVQVQNPEFVECGTCGGGARGGGANCIHRS